MTCAQVALALTVSESGSSIGARSSYHKLSRDREQNGRKTCRVKLRFGSFLGGSAGHCPIQVLIISPVLSESHVLRTNHKVYVSDEAWDTVSVTQKHDLPHYLVRHWQLIDDYRSWGDFNSYTSRTLEMFTFCWASLPPVVCLEFLFVHEMMQQFTSSPHALIPGSKIA